VFALKPLCLSIVEQGAAILKEAPKLLIAPEDLTAPFYPMLRSEVTATSFSPLSARRTG
jgi:hypothetical protein